MDKLLKHKLRNNIYRLITFSIVFLLSISSFSSGRNEGTIIFISPSDTIGLGTFQPTNPYVQRLSVLSSQKEHEKIIALIDSLHKLSPNNSILWNLQGNAYKAIGNEKQSQGCKKKAMAIIEKRLKKNPSASDVRTLAAIQTELGGAEEEIKVLYKYANKMPTEKERLTLISDAMRKEDYKSGLFLTTTDNEYLKNSREFRQYTAQFQSLLNNGKNSEAEALLDSVASNVFPNDSYVLYNISRLFAIRLNRPDKETEYLKKVKALNEDLIKDLKVLKEPINTQLQIIQRLDGNDAVKAEAERLAKQMRYPNDSITILDIYK